MARPSLLLDTSLEPAVTSGGKKLRWSQFSQVTRLCLQRVHLKQWSEHWALGSGVHRVVGTDAHLMTECGWPLGRLSAWHSVLTKQSLSSWSWVLSSVPPTLYGLDNCPSLTGLCSGSAAPRPVHLWFKVKVLHKANLIPGACTWPVPLWGNPKQSALIPACGEIVTCVGRVTTGWGHPPQSRVVPDLQFSCPGSQGRADQTSKPPQGTAHCTAPHGFLQLLLLGPPTPSSSRDSWALLWTLGSKQSVLLPHQTDQQRGWGEVQGRETCAHGGGTGVRVWSDLSPPVMVAMLGKGNLALLSLSKWTVKLSVHNTCLWTSYASTQAAAQKERLQEAVGWGSRSWASGNSLSSPSCQRTGAEGRQPLNQSQGLPQISFSLPFPYFPAELLTTVFKMLLHTGKILALKRCLQRRNTDG